MSSIFAMESWKRTKNILTGLQDKQDLLEGIKSLLNFLGAVLA